MIDEHSREDELMVQIIGLQGKIERLEKKKQEQIGVFLEDLKKYKEQIGFQKHISLDLLIEKWEEIKNE